MTCNVFGGMLNLTLSLLKKHAITKVEIREL